MSKQVVFISWFLHIFAVVGLLYCGVVFFFMFMPLSFWVPKYDVEPLKQEFQVNEPIRFKTTRTVKYKTWFQYFDVLYCKNEDGVFERLSEQPTNRVTDGGEIEYEIIWPFMPPVYRPTTCKALHSVIMNLPFDCDRKFSIHGPEFEVVEK